MRGSGGHIAYSACSQHNMNALIYGKLLEKHGPLWRGGFWSFLPARTGIKALDSVFELICFLVSSPYLEVGASILMQLLVLESEYMKMKCSRILRRLWCPVVCFTDRSERDNCIFCHSSDGDSLTLPQMKNCFLRIWKNKKCKKILIERVTHGLKPVNKNDGKSADI